MVKKMVRNIKKINDRSEKINLLKDKIKSGTYKIDSKEVAKKFINAIIIDSLLQDAVEYLNIITNKVEENPKEKTE